MYHAYVDESGTSALEPISVVAAVIIQAGEDETRAEKMVSKILDRRVPQAIRPDFHFHAKAIWHEMKDHRNLWTPLDRQILIEEMAGLPRELELIISFGVVRRSFDHDIRGLGLSISQFQHVMAFTHCLQRANFMVRKWTTAEQSMAIVAEAVPKIKARIQKAIEFFKENEFNIPLTTEYFMPTRQEIATGKVTQTLPGKMDRTIGEVNFVKKDASVLLQIADACAFSFRRCLQYQEQNWARALFGSDLDIQDWDGCMSDRGYKFSWTPIEPPASLEA